MFFSIKSLIVIVRKKKYVQFWCQIGVSLLAKWVWRFGNENAPLWKRVLCAKYGRKQEGLVWDFVEVKAGSHFIKSVNKLYDIRKRSANIINKGLRVVVGCGDRAAFWKDIEWDSNPLMKAFTRIYALALNKVGVVSIRDALAWTFCPNGSFSVKSFRRCLEVNEVLVDCLDCSFLWLGYVPPKVEVMLWQLLRGRILVREVLHKFGMPLQASSVCPLCDRESESINHLFLHCDWSWKLWSLAMGKEAILSLAIDSVKFRVALWFKLYGPSSKDLTILLLDVEGRFVDSLSTKIKASGIGEVLRDANGKVLCLFSAGVGRGDSILAELLAIHRACALISSHMFLLDRNITILSDSKMVVSWIEGEGFGNLNLVNWVYDIKQFLASLNSVSIKYTSRSCNSLADSLAKSGSSIQAERLVWGF
ncbi:hypothetical protein Ddye_022821 [Dipteronia dyeriana]|uniref:Reverse transcriptase zinc-binding domain-containing protein n=1 Tax=Dipteronia dyeriana TaxID=168575 RepID=A0AAD9WSN6_9ROSI|nr:hypothetical protein Ddye_022821 [Dipteronia dyeriana]